MKKKPIAISLFSANAHSVGKVRYTNEDALLSFETEIVRLNKKTALGLYIVADGMGGHVSGDRASAAAVDAFGRYFFESCFSDFVFGKMNSEMIPIIMTEGVHRANNAVINHVSGGGTTFTAVLVWDEQLHIAHIGDSRIYLIHEDGTSDLLTKDHSFVQTLVRMGEITEEEALTHPRRSVLMRSLGFDADVEADMRVIPFVPGDTVLLCCDGLWSVVPQKEITACVTKNTDLYTAAAELVSAANDAGGPDNISCILVRARESEEAEE